MFQKYNYYLIFFSYLVIPTLAFTYKYVIGNDFTKYLLDLMFIISLIFLCIFISRTNIKIHKYLTIYLSIAFLFGISSLFVHLLFTIYPHNNSSFFLMPFIMSLKIYIYFITIPFIVSFGRPVSLQVFLKFGLFFALLNIMDALIRYYYSGVFLRPSILSETNYDSILILLSFISYYLLKTKNSVYLIIFIISILLTQSKTSIISLFLIILYFSNIFNVKNFVGLLFLLLVSIFIIWTRMSNLDSLSNLDRFVMWNSFFHLVMELDYINILFGNPSGYYLRANDDFLSFFITHLSERAGAEGLHSFNYHSMWLRIFLDFGIISLFIIFILHLYFYKKYFTLRPFIILAFLQGFTMSFFYISVIIIPLFVFIRTLVYYQSFNESINVKN